MCRFVGVLFSQYDLYVWDGRLGFLNEMPKGLINCRLLSDTKEDIPHRASEYDDIIRHAANCKNYL